MKLMKKPRRRNSTRKLKRNLRNNSGTFIIPDDSSFTVNVKDDDEGFTLSVIGTFTNSTMRKIKDITDDNSTNLHDKHVNLRLHLYT